MKPTKHVSSFLIPLGFALLTTATQSSAAPVTLNTGDVDVSFDESTFTQTSDDFVPPTVTVTAATNGVTLDFSGISAYASTYDSPPIYDAFAQFVGDFAFTPTSGQPIGGYTVLVNGTSDIESPGDTFVNVADIGGFGFSGSEPNGAFSQSLTFSGSTLPFAAMTRP